MTAARNYAFFFTFVLNKNNDKYFLFFSRFFADGCWASMSVVIGGHQNDSRH